MSDLLRELGKSLPYDRPDAQRREAVRSSLIARAEETAPPRRSWMVAGGAFVAGVAAAAAVALIVTRPASAVESVAIESSHGAQLERTIVGDHEVVRVHEGKVRVAVAAGATVRTGDATIGGVGKYDVAVVGDHLSSITVAQGSATVQIDGQRAVFLAEGQSWTSPIYVADITPSPSGSAPTGASASAAEVATPAPAADATKTKSTGTTAVATTTTTTADNTAARPTATASTKPVPVSPSAAGASADKSGANVTKASAAGAKPSGGDQRSTASDASASASSETASGTGSSDSASGEGSNTTTSRTNPPPSNNKPNVGGPDIPQRNDTPKSGASPVESHFAKGYELLRTNHPAEAAVELGLAADGGTTDLAADARYFQAIAFVKAGRKTEAERAYVQFIDAAPKSLRRGRAAIALAKLIAERGDRASAKQWYESALTDVDPGVVAAARAGIAALH